jgi:hypothetical protein
METILVSLISEQTIPNVLFIKEIQNSINVDYYFFITTEEMEREESGNRRKWILKSCNISDEIQDYITVLPEDKNNIQKKLLERIKLFKSYDKILVNITGGTKIMSITAYEFFLNEFNSKSELWYKPINFKERFCNIISNGVSEDKDLIINYKLSVSEYLTSCGIFNDRYKTKTNFIDKKFTEEFFEKFNNDNRIRQIAEKVRELFRSDTAPFLKEIKKKDKINLDEIEDLKDLKRDLIDIQVPLIDQKILTKQTIEYITGGWFEEYVYWKIKEKYSLEDDQIKLGVVLTPNVRNGDRINYFTNNDLDVVFVYENELYVIECKTALKEFFMETVYKMAAIRKYFGLTVKSILVTLSTLDNNQKERASVFNIKTLEKEDIVNNMDKM